MKKLVKSLPVALLLALVMMVTASCSSSGDLSMSADVDKMLEGTGEATEFAEDVAYKLAYDEKLADDSTGFRTAGSDAEHRAADYLAGVFEDIGLSDVEKVPVTVDKWQFNEAYLNIGYTDKEGKAQELKIEDMVSYAAQGTKQLGGDYSGLDIVDMGMGTEADYDEYYEENKCSSMEDKIVLVGVDQWNEVWIDGPYMEAATQKAAAIISYPVSGYGEYDDDTMNIQDICAPDMKMPCTSISKSDAKKIQKVLKKGTDISAELYVDNEIGSQNGTSYNIMGTIKGTGNTGQRIIVSGHYDKYFHGFEDDCTAVGLAAGIGKAIVDSGYKPVNDIVIVAHAAEEWGRLDTSTDWAIGSWEMISTAHPEWQGSTLALINFEMPSVDDFNDKGIMRTSSELGAVGNALLDSGLFEQMDSFYKDGVEVKNDDNFTQTDCISYQFRGVPAFIPRQEDRTEWTQNRYHTPKDDNDTEDTKGDGVHSKELLEHQLSLYSMLAMYIDSTPALTLDFGSRCDVLEAAIEGTETYASAESVEAYKAALKSLREDAAANLEEAQKINSDYEEAYKAEDKAAMEKARAEGIQHNSRTLAAFRYVQDQFMGLADYGTVEVHHKALQNNIDLYGGVVDALSDGEITEDDIWLASEINGYYEYYAYLFSDEVCALSNGLLMNDKVESNWATDKMTLAIDDSWKTTKAMYAKWNAGITDPAEYRQTVSEYKGYMDILKGKLQEYVDSETEAMKTLKDMI